MSKETKSPAITVEDNTANTPVVGGEIEKVVTEMGSTKIETFVGVQPGVNFAGLEPQGEAVEA